MLKKTRSCLCWNTLEWYIWKLEKFANIIIPYGSMSNQQVEIFYLTKILNRFSSSFISPMDISWTNTRTLLSLIKVWSNLKIVLFFIKNFESSRGNKLHISNEKSLISMKREHVLYEKKEELIWGKKLRTFKWQLCKFIVIKWKIRPWTGNSWKHHMKKRKDINKLKRLWTKSNDHGKM